MTAAVAVLRDALRIFSRKGARFLGAAVAFYALLSAAPLFVVVLHVVGAIFGRPRAESALWASLSTWLAPEGIETIRTLTERLDQSQASGGVLGTLLLVYGSTRLFRALRRALNQLWGVDLEAVEAQRHRVVRYGIRYGAALALAVLVAALISVLLLVKAAFAFIGTLGVTSPPALLWVLDLSLSIAFTSVLFFALFRFLPETKVTSREAALSALVSTALFAAGSVLVTLYVKHKHLGDLYADASALVLVVFWVYYSTQVFFLGACVGAALRASRASRR